MSSETTDLIGVLVGCAGFVVTTCTVVGTSLKNRFNIKDKKIELLESKVEAQENLNRELREQNLELRITGRAVNHVFEQLPPPDPTSKELTG